MLPMLKILWLLLTFSHSKHCNGDGDDQEWYIIYRILVLSGKTLYILNISNSKYDISYALGDDDILQGAVGRPVQANAR